MKAAAFLFALTLASAARAEPQIVAGGPELEAEGHSLAVVVSGRGADGQPRPVTEPALVVDRGEPAPAIDKQSLGDFCDENPKWTPPIALGVVYQWSQGTPQAVLDGIERMFKNLPPRLTVYPTYYGQGNPGGVTKITASRAANGELADYAQVPGEQHRLALAARLNLTKLMEDSAPIKMQIIVTDGRTPQGAGETTTSPFVALGEELRRYGLQVSIVAIPPPADPDDARANLRELAEAAGARLLSANRPVDIANAIESLAETVTSADRVRFPLPLSQRLMGGPAKLSVRGVVTGMPVRTTIGEVQLPGRRDAVYLGIAAVALAGLGGLGFVAHWLSKKRSTSTSAPAPAPPRSRSAGRGSEARPRRARSGDGGEGEPEDEPDEETERRERPRPPRGPEPRAGGTRRPRPEERARGSSAPDRAPGGRPPSVNRRPEPPRSEPVADTNEDDAAEPVSPLVAHLERVVAAGLSPERAVLSLSQAFGPEAARLARATPDDIAGTPALDTRAGQTRVRAIQSLIAARPAIETFGREHADVIGPALREGVPAAEAARRLRAKLPLESWSALLRLSSTEVEAALTSANRTAPRLVDPRAAGYVREVRDQLASIPMPSLVAWLVRVSGPQTGDDTVTVPATGARAGGPGSDLVLSTQDGALVANHVDFLVDGETLLVKPAAGAVSVDGAAVKDARPLSDGQTLSLGRSLFVIRIVHGGVGAAPVRRSPRPGRAPRG